MTREEAKELLPIIQAFVAGKQIQETIEGYVGWIDTDEIHFVYEGKKIKHRIKPEPKYRPFKNQEECWNEVLKHQPFGWVRYDDSITAIQNIAPEGITVNDGIKTSSFYFEECSLKKITFVDGTPFGVNI